MSNGFGCARQFVLSWTGEKMVIFCETLAETAVVAGDEPYQRACTPEEVAILTADEAGDRTTERAEEKTLRDAWFEVLRAELENEA